MEIWNWVEKLPDDLGEVGQPHNAQLLTRLTDHLCALQIERAKALLPEARALGKTLANPWLGVFVGIGRCATGSAIYAKASVR